MRKLPAIVDNKSSLFSHYNRKRVLYGSSCVITESRKSMVIKNSFPSRLSNALSSGKAFRRWTTIMVDGSLFFFFFYSRHCSKSKK